MDIRAKLLALLAPCTPGSEILPGVRLAGASTELGMRLRFEINDGVMWIDVLPIEYAQHHAARSERLAFGYRTEGGRRGINTQLGLALCRRIAALATKNESQIFVPLEEVPDETGARVRRVQIDALLEPTGRTNQSFYTLSPYVGCTIGCRFCYASSKVNPMRAVLGLPDVPWGSYVDIRQNAPEILAAELQRLPPLPIKFCPVVSDPYQAVEKKERLTRRCLQTIRDSDRPWSAMILTRSTLILDDLDLIASMKRVFAGVSIPTIDDDVRKHFEPRAASIPDRLRILRELRRAGVRAMAIVQPIFRGDIEKLADALAECADSVSIDVLRGVMEAEDDFATPEYAPTRETSWQITQARALAGALGERGIRVWTTELPPESNDSV